MKKALVGFFLGLCVVAAFSQEGQQVRANIAATTCTNQFIRSLAAATGVGTCAAVSLTADVTGTLPIANGGTNDTGTAWTSVSLNSAVSCGGGALTTYTGSYRWKSIGKTVFVQAQITITTVGTCAFSMSFTAPAAVNATGNLYVGNGLNSITNVGLPFNATGSIIAWIITTPAANTYYGTVTYEST